MPTQRKAITRLSLLLAENNSDVRTAKALTLNGACRIASNIAKLPELLGLPNAEFTKGKRQGCGCRPKPTPKANSGPQKVRPGSRLAAHGPLSLNGDAKGISPIIAERLSPNRMPSPRRRCYSGRWGPPATPRNAISFNCSTSRFPLQADAKMICADSFAGQEPDRK